MVPTLRPWYCVSMACAQSSMTLRPCWGASDISSRPSRRAARRSAPARWHACAGSAARTAGSMFSVSGSMSASTGVAPAWMMALTVAQKVSGVVMTSSPGPTPEASSEVEAPRAGVQRDGVRRAAVAANSCSNCATLGPVPSQPERMTASTSRISSLRSGARRRRDRNYEVAWERIGFCRIAA